MLLRLRRRSSFIHGRPSGNVRDSNANALVLAPPTVRAQNSLVSVEGRATPD
jgi:hypothetical protein